MERTNTNILHVNVSIHYVSYATIVELSYRIFLLILCLRRILRLTSNF